MKTHHFIIIMVLILLITSCALPQKMDSRKKQLEQRVTRIMDAKINGEWDQVYELFCENYRSAVSKKNFTKFPRVTFLNYRLQKINMAQNGTTAVADVYISMSSKGFTFPEQLNQQQWRYQHGSWCQQVSPQGSKSIFSK